MIAGLLKTTFPSDFWNVTFFENTIAAYVTAIIIFVGALIILILIKQFLIYRLKRITTRTKIHIDDIIVDIFDAFPWWFLTTLAVAASYTLLITPEWLNKSSFVVFIVLLVYQTTRAIQVIINYFIEEKLDHDKDKGKIGAFSMFGNIIKAIVWSIAVLFALSNMGIDITSLIAGLGIGGIAIAFALQNILGDLFSSFAIYFDKPFTVGDFIIVGEHMGTVEKIGVKTTRLRSLHGEEIILSNRELTNTRVRNFRTLDNRRVVFSLGIEYQTPQKKLEAIPDIVKNIIESTPNTRFDRAHFKEFAESNLQFEIVYFVTDKTYNTYMDANQEILLAIRKEFAKEKISFAYPTQTLHIKK